MVYDFCIIYSLFHWIFFFYLRRYVNIYSTKSTKQITNISVWISSGFTHNTILGTVMDIKYTLVAIHYNLGHVNYSSLKHTRIPMYGDQKFSQKSGSWFPLCSMNCFLFCWLGTSSVNWQVNSVMYWPIKI